LFELIDEDPTTDSQTVLAYLRLLFWGMRNINTAGTHLLPAKGAMKSFCGRTTPTIPKEFVNPERQSGGGDLLTAGFFFQNVKPPRFEGALVANGSLLIG